MILNYFSSPASLPSSNSYDNILNLQLPSLQTSCILFYSDGELYHSIHGLPGDTVTAPDTPAKTGYTFIGWSSAIPAELPQGTTVLNAVWIINSYTVSFMIDSLTPYISLTCNYGQAVSEPTAPSRDDYEFVGWSDTEGSTTPLDTLYVMGNTNMTYYAVWRRVDSFTATFYAFNDDDDVIVNNNVSPTIPIYLPAPTTKTDYAFDGWYTSADYSSIGYPVGEPYCGNSNVEFYAKWRLVGALAPAAGHTTVIDTERKLVYGLGSTNNINFTEATLREWIVANDGYYITISPSQVIQLQGSAISMFGTGTKIEIFGGVTDELLDTYYTVIFGDVTGDCRCDTADSSAIRDETQGLSNWSDVSSATYSFAKLVAGDLNHNGIIDEDDLRLIKGVANYVMQVDQVTGVCTEY